HVQRRGATAQDVRADVVEAGPVAGVNRGRGAGAFVREDVPFDQIRAAQRGHVEQGTGIAGANLISGDRVVARPAVDAIPHAARDVVAGDHVVGVAAGDVVDTRNARGVRGPAVNRIAADGI